MDLCLIPYRVIIYDILTHLYYECRKEKDTNIKAFYGYFKLDKSRKIFAIWRNLRVHGYAMKYLEYTKISKPEVQLGADIAFLLKPAHSKKVKTIFLKEKININHKKNPLIGIGPSSLIYTALKSNKEDYIKLMAQIADFLVEKLNAQVILISHIIIPSENRCMDDRFVAKKIHQLVRNKSRIKILKIWLNIMDYSENKPWWFFQTS